MYKKAVRMVAEMRSESKNLDLSPVDQQVHTTNYYTLTHAACINEMGANLHTGFETCFSPSMFRCFWDHLEKGGAMFIVLPHAFLQPLQPRPQRTVTMFS